MTRSLAAVFITVITACVVAGCTADSHHMSTTEQDRAAPIIERNDNQGWQEDFTGGAGSPVPGVLFNHDLGGGGWGNGELQTYTASTANSRLDGSGHLTITAIGAPDRSRDPTSGWSSARLSSQGRWSFTTGTLEARIKVPSGTGLWPAFWLAGADIGKVGWPACGEIDIFEFVDRATTLSSTVHGPILDSGRPWALARRYSPGLSFASAYHTYGVSRTKGKIDFLLDGRVIQHIYASDVPKTDQWVFDKPMHFLLNLAVGGSGPSAVTAQTPSEASMLVDWIRFSPDPATR